MFRSKVDQCLGAKRLQKFYLNRCVGWLGNVENVLVAVSAMSITAGEGPGN